MDFILLILVTGTLYIRPSELIPSLETIPIYEILIVLTLLISIGPLLGQLSSSRLREQPITVCVVGLLIASLLSNLSHLDVAEAFNFAFEFGKTILYYMLVVEIVNSTSRLRWLLFWLVIFYLVSAVLTVLDFHGILNIPAIDPLIEYTYDMNSGEEIPYERLRGTGLFGDPNDICLNLSVAMMICLYGLGDRGLGLLRIFWLLPFALFGYAVHLTRSRGGFLMVLAGLLVLFRSRFPGKKSLFLIAIALPLMFILFRGRQTSLSTSEGTAQQRVQIWQEGLQQLRNAPLFGIGTNKYVQYAGLVAHNSYVHISTELGFFGGMLFVGAFYHALRTIHRLGSTTVWLADPELRQIRPYLMALITSYALGMMSLTETYIVPTYTVLGLATAYIHLTGTTLPLSETQFNQSFLKRSFYSEVFFLIFIFLFIKFNINY